MWRVRALHRLESHSDLHTRREARRADVEPYLLAGRSEHHPQPRVISISNTTEWGDVYERDELRELCAFAHERGLLVHVDGARIANAAAALGATPREITKELGVDALTFGGTKNGLLGGEAACFFDPKLSAHAGPYVRKQAMQLASKMRYIAAQFEALLTNDRWLAYASHANAMAQRLLSGVRNIPGVTITRPVRANAIFATMDRAAIARAQETFFFYCFDEALPEVRWMTHWATTEADIDAFVTAVKWQCHPQRSEVDRCVRVSENAGVLIAGVRFAGLYIWDLA